MKFLILVGFCAVAAYAAPVAEEVTSALARAEDLIKTTQKIIADHKANNRAHLLDNIEYQLARFEKVAHDLEGVKAMASEVDAAKEMATLTNKLDFFEARLNEELSFVEDVYKNAHASGRTTDELLAYATTLLGEAKKAVARFAQDSEHSDAEIQIHSEIFQVQMLYNALNYKSATLGPVAATLEEEALVLHERSLFRLIQLLQ